jgi:hypothetical protein
MAHRCDAAARPSTAKLRERGVPDQKKGRSKGAAKFREETPRKGRDISCKHVIPRCSNMAAFSPDAKRVPWRKLEKS